MNKKEFLGTSLHTGLKCICSGKYTEESEGLDDQIPFVFKIVGMNDEWVDVIGRLKTVTENQMIVDCFPIARPLSDLTKPITHNGETFIPIVELAKIVDEFNNTNPTFVYVKTFSGWYCEWYAGDQISIRRSVPFCFYQKLIEWHFAIGLKDDEYIDVNSLSDNPYK